MSERDDLTRLLDSAIQGTGHAIHAELVEAKLRYFDRALDARDGRAAKQAYHSYVDDIFHVVLGAFHRDDPLPGPPDQNPVRSLNLGQRYDDDLQRARTEYLERCARAHSPDDTFQAYCDYRSTVSHVVSDALDAAARNARPTRDALKPESKPTPSRPAPAITVEPVGKRERVQVVSIDRLEDRPDDGRTGLDRAPAPAPEPPAPAPVADAYARVDARLRDAWKTPPATPPKPKKGAQRHDPVH